MKEYKTVQLEKDIHQKLSLLAAEQNRSIKDVLTEIVERSISGGPSSNEIQETDPESPRTDLSAIKKHLEGIEREMKIGFNMVTTNQQKFGLVSKEVNDSLLGSMATILNSKKI
jgi:hypothetical protein